MQNLDSIIQQTKLLLSTSLTLTEKKPKERFNFHTLPSNLILFQSFQWHKRQQSRLIKLVDKYKKSNRNIDWENIAKYIRGSTAATCQAHYLTLEKRSIPTKQAVEALFDPLKSWIQMAETTPYTPFSLFQTYKRKIAPYNSDRWTREQDAKLLEAYASVKEGRGRNVAVALKMGNGKTAAQCFQRYRRLCGKKDDGVKQRMLN